MEALYTTEHLDVSAKREIEIFHGDCLEVMKKIPSASIDMVMADPPYGITQCKWDSIIHLETMWEELKRVTKNNGAILLMAAQPFTTKLIGSNMEMFKYCWVWEKSRSTGFLNAWRRPLVNTEDICVFYKKPPNYMPILVDRELCNIRKHAQRSSHTNLYGNINLTTKKCPYDKSMPKTIIKFNVSQNRLHPTEKPVLLMEYLIKTYTNKGDRVLDFCMGSGTTGLACINLGRSFIGIEKDDKYFEIAKERLNKATELNKVIKGN